MTTCGRSRSLTENYKQQTRASLCKMWKIVEWYVLCCAMLCCVVRRSLTSVGLRSLIRWTTTTQDDGQRNATIDQPNEIIEWFFVCSLEKCRSLREVRRKWLFGTHKTTIVRTRHCFSRFCIILSFAYKKKPDDDDVDDDDDEFFNPTHFNRRADFPQLGLPVCAPRVCFHNFRFGLCVQMKFSTLDASHTYVVDIWRKSIDRCISSCFMRQTTDVLSFSACFVQCVGFRERYRCVCMFLCAECWFVYLVGFRRWLSLW